MSNDDPNHGQALPKNPLMKGRRSSFKPEHPPQIKPAPQIMGDLVTFLRERGHECAMIIGYNDYSLEWCGEDECPRAGMWEKMAQRQKEEEELEQKLYAEGHTCVCIAESYPQQTMWCEQTPCKDANK